MARCGTLREFGRILRRGGHDGTSLSGYADGALVIRQLQPWHENIKKRQVKAPRIYLRDTGILHALLGIGDLKSLNSHPEVGRLVEGLLLETVIEQLGLPEQGAFFWSVHSGAELDLLLSRGRRRIGIEIKRTTAPKVTRSMRTAAADLGLHEVVVIHAGPESYRLASNVRAVAPVASKPI